jgi:hypothetical protein
MTDGKPIAVFLQSISGVITINPLVAFYDIQGGRREVLLFYFIFSIYVYLILLWLPQNN